MASSDVLLYSTANQAVLAHFGLNKAGLIMLKQSEKMTQSNLVNLETRTTTTGWLEFAHFFRDIMQFMLRKGMTAQLICGYVVSASFGVSRFK